MILDIQKYAQKLSEAMSLEAMGLVPHLAESMKIAWETNANIYIFGNGGSAGNAIHLANDFIYGSGTRNEKGISIESLSANAAIITCLANDIGYEEVYSEQLRVKANKGDILIALSGSGNSKNIIRAIEQGNKVGMQTFAILGFDGGECKNIAKYPIHFQVDDMQIAEDLQLIVGHMCMQWLYKQNITINKWS